MTPNLGTWETINADVTDRGRRGQIKLVWERHGEINYRQAIFCCSDFQASAVLQTIGDMSLECRRASGLALYSIISELYTDQH